MLFRNFGQTHPRAPVANNLISVDVKWRAAYSSAFQFRSAHSGSNSLDDQTLLELGNSTHDHDDRSTERA